MKKHTAFIIIISLATAIALLFSSCNTSKRAERMQSAASVFEEGKKLFDDEDWLEAQKLFDLILLQYPASSYADDAQFYLAEINFNRGEYIYASFNYSRLRRYHTQSEYVKMATYKTAMCYYELSPPFDRDQEYTLKAIQAFSEFQSLYPKDSLYKSASEKIQELREKLAYKEFFTAELYLKLNNPFSASVYYDFVIKDYPDSKYYEDAFIGKIETLKTMRKYGDALSLIELYNYKFPNGKYKDRINLITSEIKK
jgi:outer membrane protein assembly factor BamD